MAKQWTENEKQIIRDNWKEKSDSEIAPLLPGRTIKAITHKRHLMGLKHFEHVNHSPGDQFSYLTVIREVEERSTCGAIQYLCDCKCGKKVVVQGIDLRSGHMQSCGCKNEEHIASIRMKPARVAMRQVYQQYEHSARDRDYEWDLPIELFKKLTKQPCFYCGALPHNVSTKREGQVYVYNGIDRVDNEKGYTLNNVVPCCKICNWMKRDLAVEEFIEHCRQVVQCIDTI